MTRTRGFLLTPAYAAPEQWLEAPAEEMDGRTDLYALGCVFYEMLTGSTPFHAHNTAGWMKQHLEDAPRPPSTLRPELANWPGLDSLVLRLLAKDSNQRPKDAAEVVTLLDAVRYVPEQQQRQTLAENTTKPSQTLAEDTRKPSVTVVERTAAQPEMIAEKVAAKPITVSEITQTQPRPAPAQTEVQKPEPVIPEPYSETRRFPGWAWGALAAFMLLAAVTTWRLNRTVAPQPQSQQAQAPVTQPVTQRKPAIQPPAQTKNLKPSNQPPETSVQPKPAPAESLKPPVQQPEVALEPKPAPAENSKPPNQPPNNSGQPKPAPTESPRTPVQGTNIAEAETLDKQKRDSEAAARAAQQQAALSKEQFAAGEWVDHPAQLMWTWDNNGRDIDWKGAIAYCHALRTGGFSDWRLPSTSELYHGGLLTMFSGGTNSRWPVPYYKVQDYAGFWSGTEQAGSPAQALVRRSAGAPGIAQNVPPNRTRDMRAVCVRPYVLPAGMMNAVQPAAASQSQPQSQPANGSGQPGRAQAASAPDDAESYFRKGQALIAQATIDTRTEKITLPPGCADAYRKYLELAPNGRFAKDVKAILDSAGEPIKSAH
jgi:serine/threonine protein kinase